MVSISRSTPAGWLLLAAILCISIPVMCSKQAQATKASTKQYYQEGPYGSNSRGPYAEGPYYDRYSEGPYGQYRDYYKGYGGYDREGPYGYARGPEQRGYYGYPARDGPYDSRYSEGPYFRGMGSARPYYDDMRGGMGRGGPYDGPYKGRGPYYREDPYYGREGAYYGREEPYGREDPYRMEGPYDSQGPYGREGPYEQYGQEHYEEEVHLEPEVPKKLVKEITPICLQRKGVSTVPGGGPNATDVYTETFRCCTQMDDADRCVHNNTYPGYDAYQSPSKNQAHDFLLNQISQSDTAATCKWQVLADESCPSFLNDPACLVVELNCTLSLEAKKCGCPLEADTALLNSKMYVRNTPSLTCAVTGPSTALNTYFQGQINQILIPYGHMDCKGSIEYSQRLSVTAPATAPYPQGVPWMKDGQMIIRVLADKWVPMDDHYHEGGMSEHP